MTDSACALVIESYGNTHKGILGFLRKLSEEQLQWQITPNHLSIAWHAWHVARWADHFQAAVPGMTPELGRRLGEGAQVWHIQKIAAQWSFDPAQLGYKETGMEMADDIATRLPFPAKAQLLDYVAAAFEAALRAAAAIDEVQFNSLEQPQALSEGLGLESTVGAAVMIHITHANRHLGMIECLLGLQGQSGSATR